MSTQLPNTLATLAHDLRAGNLNLHLYLDYLEDFFNQIEPEIHSFVHEEARFKRLHLQASSLLNTFPEPEERPVLFGVPVGVKDIFQVTGLPTRAGSRLPKEILRGAESKAVSALKSAGALILGKTVTTEFAYFAPGPTRNPHNPEHTPGGSSSGSAAAVASGLSTLALGTQTIGSVNRPAAFCGVVGFKPSYERIPREGVIPLSPSADHVGFFSPIVTDAALVASLLCSDWQPVSESEIPVLGIPEGEYLSQAWAEGREHFQSVCRLLEDEGYEIKAIQTMPDFAEIVERHQLIVAADAAIVHKIWYEKYGNLYHEKTRALIERGQKITEKDLENARQGQLKLRQELGGLMEKNGIDLWIAPPAVGPAPRGLESTGDPVMNLPWTHAGLPTLTIPAGLNEAELPLGLQVIGDWFADEKLIHWSTDIEKRLSF